MQATTKFKEINYEFKGLEWQIYDFRRLALTTDCIRSDDFSFAQSVWCLELYTRLRESNEFMELYVFRDEALEHEVEYTFDLRRWDGTVVQLLRGIMKKGKVFSKGRLIKKEEFLDCHEEFLANLSSSISIICTLKIEKKFRKSKEKTKLTETKAPMLTNLDTLSENFRNLFVNKEGCDVTLKVKDKEFKAHKSVLIARSNVFAANFKHDMLEKQTGAITILDCDPDSFQQFLEYLYCGKLQELSFPSALNLYYTSDKYDIGDLKAFCIKYLKKNITTKNVCEVAEFADKHDEMTLFHAVQQFFNKNSCRIFETDEWECFIKEDFQLGNKLLKNMSKA